MLAAFRDHLLSQSFRIQKVDESLTLSFGHLQFLHASQIWVLAI